MPLYLERDLDMHHASLGGELWTSLLLKVDELKSSEKLCLQFTHNKSSAASDSYKASATEFQQKKAKMMEIGGPE